MTHISAVPDQDVYIDPNQDPLPGLADVDLDAIQQRMDRLRFLGPFGGLKVTRVELTGADDLEALRTLLGRDLPALIAEAREARKSAVGQSA